MAAARLARVVMRSPKKYGPAARHALLLQKQLVTVDDGDERRLTSELLRTVCGHSTSIFWRRKKAPADDKSRGT
jgi:hypothetical protein